VMWKKSEPVLVDPGARLLAPSVKYADGVATVFYRKQEEGKWSEVWSAVSTDWENWGNKRAVVAPSRWFDYRGCEDPRIVVVEGVEKIIYTGVGIDNTARLVLCDPNGSNKRLLLPDEGWNKSGFITPVGEKYVLLYEKQPYGDIWMRESEDLMAWSEPIVWLSRDKVGAKSIEIGNIVGDTALVNKIVEVDRCSILAVKLNENLNPTDEIEVVAEPSEVWDEGVYFTAGGCDVNGRLVIPYSTNRFIGVITQE